MVDKDSDNYELMPSQELDDLRREVSILKNNSLKDGDKARILIDSMDRLTISINRLITILDDAEKDIINEYQESKPTEKLNQLSEQNQAIARALIAISDNLTGGGGSRSIFPPTTTYQNTNPMPQQNTPMGNSRPPSYSINPPMFQMPDAPGAMNDLPPMDTIPPLDNPSPMTPKKKFLGIM